MQIEKFIFIIMICMFVGGFALGCKAGASWEKEKEKNDVEIH